jgi:hypothetical protein
VQGGGSSAHYPLRFYLLRYSRSTSTIFAFVGYAPSSLLNARRKQSNTELYKGNSQTGTLANLLLKWRSFIIRFRTSCLAVHDSLIFIVQSMVAVPLIHTRRPRTIDISTPLTQWSEKIQGKNWTALTIVMGSNGCSAVSVRGVLSLWGWEHSERECWKSNTQNYKKN